ncbi:MAG: DeoR/GlpR family DNA-binding transcription regulator [Acetobacteraceae bacterium]
MPVQRHALILGHIRQHGAATIHDLAKAIGTSTSTIRRDLERLEARHALRRARGGAVLPADPFATFEPAAGLAAQLARTEKRLIGAAAAEMLTPGESVIFDSSTTVLCAARAVVARAISLTAVTNDLGIAQVLAQSEAIRVLVLGGTIRHGSLSLIGDPGRAFLASLHADVVLLGTHTVSGRLITDTSIEIAAMKRAMIKAARRVVLLADSSKFRCPAFCTICDLSEISALVTDDRVDPSVGQAARELGIAVTVVKLPRMEQGQ